MNFDLNSKKAFKAAIMAYLLACGILSNDDIDAICKYNNVKLSDKEKKSALKDEDLYFDGKFYSRYNLKELNELLVLRNDYKIRLLTIDDIMDYMIYIGTLFDELDIIIEPQVAEYVFILAATLRLFDDIYFEDELIKDKDRLSYLEHAGVKKKDINKIIKVFNKYGDKLRYWSAYGRNNGDLGFDGIIEDTLLNKKPKEETLINCLKSLDEDGYNNVYYTYLGEAKSVEDLKNTIIETMKESVKHFTVDEYNRFMNCNHQEITYEFSDNDFMQGFVFAYDDNGIIKTLVPKEVKDILKSVDVNELEDYDKLDLKEQGFDNLKDAFDYYIRDIIIGYFEMNGVIEKSVLQKLLKNNHGIDLDFEAMDDTIKPIGEHVIHKNYYSIVNDDYLAKELLEKKKIRGDYRKLTPELLTTINNYLDEINKVCNGNDELEFNINILTRLGGINKEIMAEIKDEFSLSKTVSNKINDIVKKYKNIIPLWISNGYCQESNNSTIKKDKKIGRNEPCPCGSGKKYKKCCGR